MTENLEDLPIAEADRYAREQIEHHREQMQAWRRRRAARLASERATTGRTVADIADEIGVSRQTANDLVKLARQT